VSPIALCSGVFVVVFGMNCGNEAGFSGFAVVTGFAFVGTK
jgi:hypothetical protein